MFRGPSNLLVRKLSLIRMSDYPVSGYGACGPVKGAANDTGVSIDRWRAPVAPRIAGCYRVQPWGWRAPTDAGCMPSAVLSRPLCPILLGPEVCRSVWHPGRIQLQPAVQHCSDAGFVARPQRRGQPRARVLALGLDPALGQVAEDRLQHHQRPRGDHRREADLTRRLPFPTMPHRGRWLL